MEREELIESALAHARGLGWEEFTVEDNGATVIVLCSAPGSTEQLIDEPLRKLRSAFSDLGGPENYLAVEEFDIDNFVAELVMDTVAVLGPAEEAAQPSWRDDQNAAAAIVHEREAEQAYQDYKDDIPQHVAVPEVGEVKPHGLDPWLYYVTGGDPMNLKQLYRAVRGHTDAAERGDGIPRPEQIVKDLEASKIVYAYVVEGVDINTGKYRIEFKPNELPEAREVAEEARRRAHKPNYAEAVKLLALWRIEAAS